MTDPGKEAVLRAIASITPIHEADDISEEARTLSGAISLEGWDHELTDREIDTLNGLVNLTLSC